MSSTEKLEILVEMLTDCTFLMKRNLDSFHKVGDSITITGLESSLRNDIHSNLTGTSTNEEVGEDLWSIYWVVDNITRKNITSGDPGFDADIEEAYLDWEDSDDDEEE